ncbi:hypothetical protein G4B88_009428 [Cannabis sativa]|uniref:DUF8039 domain-containing protein n=1 Tax=Cannabis sativa TaxID=3483 RepID=A0A7J6GH01_CANSA|nr:hypothetical protein G4B88_009428 [Cannabis sativa]
MEKELGHQLTEFDRSDIWMRMHTNKKGEIEGPAKEVVDRIMNELLQAFRSQQSNTCGTSHASGSAVGGASNEPPTVSRAYSPPPPSAQFVKASARPHAPPMGASAPPPVPPIRTSTPPPAPPLKASTPRPAPPLKASTPRPLPPLKASTPRPAPPLTASTPRPAPPLTASTPPTPAPSVTSKKKLKCNLHVEDRSMNKPPLVATGHVVIQPKLEKLRVDGKEYDDTYSCVFIEKIIKHNALLPQPLEQQGFRTVGEAIGYYVAWPRAYIVLEKSNQETVRPAKKARTDNPLGPPTQDLKHPLRPSKLSVTRYPKPGLTITLKKLKTMYNIDTLYTLDKINILRDEWAEFLQFELTKPTQH